MRLWVMNGHLTYSSPSMEKPRAAMKILFKEISLEEGEEAVQNMPWDTEEIHLPGQAIEVALGQLKDSNQRLPRGGKVFQDWRVGLLDKWE
jgi:hypothetical protein